MTKFLLRLSIASAAVLALSVVPALAYPESTLDVEPSGVPPLCSDCHGLESRTQETSTVAQSSKPATWSAFDTEAGTFVGSRKGPHGGYTDGTQKCDTCHTVHGAAANTALLRGATIAATCNTCHDGTGGGGVYGVIKYRSPLPLEPAGGHRVKGASTDATSGTVTVPGGNPDGGPLDVTFTGENGELTCTDCHSPHNSDTVNPFIGDRKRSSADTSTQLATNRLLRKKPTLGSVSVNEYGSDWCESCHKSHLDINSKSHPVARIADGAYYRKVEVRAATGTTLTAAAPTNLGGSNLGYVIPTTDTVRPTRPKPICQQCHEDARHVGDVQSFSIVASETFAANTDGAVVGNPQFQNFPHETQGANMLIEQNSDLCENCHKP